MSGSGKKRGDVTRKAILAAAEVAFAEHGFDGARIDNIASASGYNKNLIFRYFGDKLGLYIQVLERADRDVNALMAHVFEPLQGSEATVFQAPQLRAFLETMIQALFDYLLEHPRLVRILTWEMAEGWQTLLQIASQFPTEDSRRFGVLFRKAYSAGLLRSDFAPMIQLAMIVQLCQAYLVSLPLYQQLLPGEDLSSASALAQARKYFVNLIVAGMMFDLSEIKTEKGR